MPLFSHYGDVPDISDKLSIPSLVFAIVTPLFVVARFVSKIHFAKNLGSDDWTILAALVCGFTVNVMMIVVCELAFGKHAKQMDPAITAKTMKLYFFAQILYKINIGLTKVSILLLYRRIFVQKWFQRTALGCIVVVMAFTTGTTFSSIFQCTPVAKAFDKSIKEGSCINLTAFWYANAAFNIFSDLVIISLPMPCIKSLQLPRKSKLALSAVFAIGLFVCVTSVLRIQTLNLATNRLDVTWNSIGSSMWTVIESNLGIICACMPALRRPLTLLFPTLFGRMTSKQVYANDSTDQYNTGNGTNRSHYSVRAKALEGGTWMTLDDMSADNVRTDTHEMAGNERYDGRTDTHEMAGNERYDGRTDGITKTTEVRVESYV